PNSRIYRNEWRSARTADPGEFPGGLKIPCNKLQGIFDREECARFRGSAAMMALHVDLRGPLAYR
ncbi:MAG TPA: hypothetical protein VFX82_10830, partial [Desulfobacterales bacterium]|nr:hypothetical protein [Desulfobacterales bacterium]